MNAFQKVKEELGKFREKREAHETVKLNQQLERSKKEYANAKVKEQIVKNKEYAQTVNAKAREQRFAPFKALAQRVSNNAQKKRSGRTVNLGGNTPGGTGSIFTAQSNTPNNIYFKGSSGNNPFNFSGRSPIKKKSKGKRITINL